jgi:demethylmenaquinone methyltransferase/2-methoxy-6-polyprenyl-1,4-benzoquinol methylase
MQKAETPAMFTEIASRYDLLNHLLSFNVDRLWRRQLIRLAALPDDGRVLDACTGTADVAIGFARAHATATVAGLDRSAGMLSVGQKKLDKAGLNGRVRLYEGDVLHLPFGDRTFDAVTIAFGLRNLPDYSRGVAEMSRVLKPGGRLLILDFSPPQRGLRLKAYRLYLHNVLPVVGGLVSGSRRAYQYLASSIGEFLPRDAAFALLSESGLTDLSARKLTGGIAYIYGGVKPG